MTNRCIAISLLWLFSFFVLGAEVKSFTHENQSVSIELSDNTHVDIDLINAKTLAVNYRLLDDRVTPPALKLFESTDSLTFRVKDKDDTLHFVSGNVTVVAQKAPFSLAFWYKGELKTKEEIGVFAHPTIRGFRFALQPDEKLMGGGQRVLGTDRRNHRMPLYNRAHYGYGSESNQMYYSLPAVLSNRNYALAFDNTASGYLDIGKAEHDVLQFEAVGGKLRYIVSMGESMSDVSQHLIAALGKQPLPPRWALGNFASRFGYRSEQETRAIVNAYATHAIPLDAVVLDLYWFGKDIKGHMGNLNWDKNAFPNPEKMIADFADQNIKTVVITEPFILDTSSTYTDAVESNALATNLAGEPKMFDFYFGHTGIIDVFNNAAQDWFWQFYAKLMDQGVAGWWGDLGEPEVHPGDTLHKWDNHIFTADEIHNIYGHQWAEMVYERTLKAQPDKRPFVLMRAGYLGSQRYGMMPWTGDVSRSWEGFKAQVELSLQMGIFGLGYIHSDLGGFAGGDEFDKDLYLRWLQLGTFSPVFRPHAQEHIPPEPVMHSQDVIDAAKKLIDLRYQMLPYNYTLSFDNTLYGKPLMRPLSFHFEQQKWFDNKDSYMWGEAFLVSPVTDAKQTEWKVDLPQGRWYDFWSGNAFDGNQIITYPLTQHTFPVLVKAGAFVPMVEPASNSAEINWSSMQFHYWYSEESSDYTYFEDSGNAPLSIQEKQFLTMELTAQPTAGKLNLNIQINGDYPTAPTSRNIQWVVHGLQAIPKRIDILGGKSVEQQHFSAHGITWLADKNELLLPSTLLIGDKSSVVIHL
ncbi:TIM-barrel domain-containing protein [Alteromonas sp. ASW11-130]|uniref:TIM-barrel domain-containing protein n=1 Tax=Alteromonas sp. ASW11-130 TaxID=3015775 RepID=UPI002241D4FF|nr:TIM-barrel domain-containing protein [Alteromonas sp. ASW11-130]MCW8092192.1 DUF5110 domain-containing protein [Alteromonas sp. ASW11-130]